MDNKKLHVKNQIKRYVGYVDNPAKYLFGWVVHIETPKLKDKNANTESTRIV